MNILRVLICGLAAVSSSGVVGRLSAQPGSATNVAISTACLQALGVDCTKDPQQRDLWYDLMAQVNGRHIAASESAIVQQYLIPALRRNPGMQAAVVDRAYKYQGKTAGSFEESQWTRQYESWQTYERLVPMIPRAAAPVVAAPAQPQFSQQQQQQALQTAFQFIWGRLPSPSESALFNTVTPANMPGSVRSALRNYPGEAPRIVATVFPSIVGRPPTEYERAGVVSVFERYWTGADDLATYLRDVTASYRTPNYGPNTAAQTTAPLAPGTHYFDRNNMEINSSALASLPRKNGVFVDNNGNPLSITYKVISNDGGSIISSGLVAAGGGNLVAAGGGNLVSNAGGTYHVQSVGAAPAANNGVCHDALMTKAIQVVARRAPKGSGDTGECALNLYGGTYGGYSDLVVKVGRTLGWPRGGNCRDAWITQATVEVRGVLPSGSGDMGQCDARNYNHGQWANYPALVGGVKAYYGLR